MKRVTLAALALALTAAAAGADERSAALYDEGVEHAAGGRLAEAGAAFERAVAADPLDLSAAVALEIMRDAESGEIHEETAVGLFRSFTLGNADRADEAVAAADAAVALDPDYAKAYAARGNIHRLLEQREQAIADYGKAIELDPQDAEAYHSRAAMHLETEQYDDALADFTRAVERDPQYSLSWFGLGIVHANHERDYDRALLAFARALEIDPGFEDVYVNRGLIHLHAKKDYAAAIADFRKVLEINPGRVEMHLQVANACERAGRLDDAVAAYRAYIADAPPEQASVVEEARQRIGEIEQ
ncbi:MAG TPA: tetratricopeptide repeat protein [Gammaproteobacteria bacterium]|nr:tetratricopeptide repeat protein [Gammaproteobacteria bacterium]